MQHAHDAPLHNQRRAHQRPHSLLDEERADGGGLVHVLEHHRSPLGGYPPGEAGADRQPNAQLQHVVESAGRPRHQGVVGLAQQEYGRVHGEHLGDPRQQLVQQLFERQMAERHVGYLLEAAQRLGGAVGLEARLPLGRVEARVVGSRRLRQVFDEALHAAPQQAHQDAGHQHGAHRDHPLLARARRVLVGQHQCERDAHPADLEQRLAPVQEVERHDADPDVEHRVHAGPRVGVVDGQRDQRGAERERRVGRQCRQAPAAEQQQHPHRVGDPVHGEQAGHAGARRLREGHRHHADRRAGDEQDPQQALHHGGVEQPGVVAPDHGGQHAPLEHGEPVVAGTRFLDAHPPTHLHRQDCGVLAALRRQRTRGAASVKACRAALSPRWS